MKRETRQMKLIRFILLISFWLINFLTADGFLSGTLIKTAIDSVAIEDLSTNDLIISHDKRTCQPVLITSKIVDQYIKICIEDEYICAALEQKFYLPKENRWICAKKLGTEHFLLKSDGSFVSIDSVELIKMPEK